VEGREVGREEGEGPDQPTWEDGKEERRVKEEGSFLRCRRAKVYEDSMPNFFKLS
jgi:hypothetical protein